MSDLAKLFIIIIIKKVKIIVTLSIKNTAGALYKSQIKGENDTKHRAVSLRHLSFLFAVSCDDDDANI